MGYLNGLFLAQDRPLKAAQPAGEVVDTYVESCDFLYAPELICADAQLD
jgi:hypothetical protein